MFATVKPCAGFSADAEAAGDRAVTQASRVRADACTRPLTPSASQPSPDLRILQKGAKITKASYSSQKKLDATR
jgi:hypothetical protein